MTHRIFFLLAGLALAACDTPATASDPQAWPKGEPQRSRELESCSASVQCGEGLRCFDQECRRVARSVLGDYAAALGARARGRNELPAALNHYADAIARYQADGVEVPPDIECAYGGTLAAVRADKEKAELAARVLHRCILAAPVGSSLRAQALRDLADLYESGLDPLHLARTQPADVYLSRSPARPATENIKIAITADPAPTAKSFPAVVARLGEPDLRPAMVGCWEKYFAATKKDALAVQVAIKSRYIESEYDDEAGHFAVATEGTPPTPATPEAEAAACVRSAIDPALLGLKAVKDSFVTTLTVRIQ